MAHFQDRSEDWNRTDYRLVRGGAINVYSDANYLERDLRWLTDHGYEVKSFDCARWFTVADFHREMAEQLEFPDFYGRNLAALRDCLTMLRVKESSGMVILLRDFHQFAVKEPDTSRHVLDFIDEASRNHLLFGRIVFAILHPDDPVIPRGPFGATQIKPCIQELLRGIGVGYQEYKSRQIQQ